MSKPSDSYSHPTRPAEESLLWKRFKEGDQEAFSQLYKLFNNALFKYGMTLVRDRERVKDGLQELFVELWNRRANLSDVQSVRFYLLISLRRLLFKKQASAPNLFGLDNLDDETGSFAAERSPESDYIQRQTDMLRNDQVWREIENLPRRQKEAIYLRYYQGLSYEEVTAIMAVEYQVVRNLIYKAIKNLRTKLAGHIELFILLGLLNLMGF